MRWWLAAAGGVILCWAAAYAHGLVWGGADTPSKGLSLAAVGISGAIFGWALTRWGDQIDP